MDTNNATGRAMQDDWKATADDCAWCTQRINTHVPPAPRAWRWHRL